MKRLSRLLLVLVAWCGIQGPSAVAAEDIGDRDELETHFEPKPSLLSASSIDDITAALGWEARIRYDYAPSKYGGLWIQGESKGVVATDARANSEGMFASANLGWFHQWEPFDSRATTNRTPTGRAIPRLEYRGIGVLLDLSGKVKFETDQPFENYNLVYGPEIGFTPLRRKGFYQLIPTVYAAYQRVDVLQSEAYEARGIADDSFWRLDLHAGWDLDIGTWWFSQVHWLRPVSLGFDVDYYRAFELPNGASEAGFDDGLFYAGTFNYSFRALYDGEPAKWTDWLPLAYVKAGHGRKPPVVDEQTMLYFGLVFTWGKSSRDQP